MLEHISSVGNTPRQAKSCMIRAGTTRTVYSFNRTFQSGYPADATNAACSKIIVTRIYNLVLRVFISISLLIMINETSQPTQGLYLTMQVLRAPPR